MQQAHRPKEDELEPILYLAGVISWALNTDDRAGFLRSLQQQCPLEVLQLAVVCIKMHRSLDPNVKTLPWEERLQRTIESIPT